jgi:pimeloyl-ACP methyl ester carboxylesterase
VLIDAFAFVPWYFKVFVNPVYGGIAYRSTFANPAGRWLTNATLRNRRTPDTHLTDSFREIDANVSRRYLQMLDGIDSVRRFAGITAPTDLLYGANTFAAVKASIHEWKAIWPHARVWPLQGAGHLPLEDAAPAVAAVLFENAAAGNRT